MSNNSATIAVFGRKYLNFLTNSCVKASAAKWLMRHAQAYVKAAEGRQVGMHTAADVEAWLGELDRIGGMEAWQYVQAVDAVLRNE